MPSERRLNGLQGIMHLHGNIDGSEYNWCGHCENMHAIMDERYARNGMILILECRYAGQPWFKNNMTPPSQAAHDSYSMTPHTPVGIRCEHAGIMQRTNVQGIIQHMPRSEPCWSADVCCSLKLTGVLPACFQVNQVRKPFLNAITCRFQCIKHMKNQITEIFDFDSDGDFTCFVSNASKIGFTTILIKTAVHRAEYSVPCGRHRFSVFKRFAISCWDRALISLTSIFTDSQYGNTSSSY